MKRYAFYSAFGDAGAGAAPAVDPYAIPMDAEVVVGDDGSVRIIESIAGEPAGVAPAPLTTADFRGFMDGLREAVTPAAPAAPADPAAAPALPEFDPTQFINDDQSIDMVGLGKGISAHTIAVARAAAAAAVAEVSSQFGAPVSNYAAQSLADRLAADYQLGDVGKTAITAQLKGMAPAQIAALDENSLEMLVAVAERRERAQAALVEDTARPGGGGGRRETALTLAVPDPKGIGWAGYCRTRGWDPADKAAIAEGRRTGVLK